MPPARIERWTCLPPTNLRFRLPEVRFRGSERSRPSEYHWMSLPSSAGAKIRPSLGFSVVKDRPPGAWYSGMRPCLPARGRFRGLRIVAVVVRVIAGAAVPCRAALGEFAVDVRCPALAGEVEAEFEARVRVDLALRASDGGALAID